MRVDQSARGVEEWRHVSWNEQRAEHRISVQIDEEPAVKTGTAAMKMRGISVNNCTSGAGGGGGDLTSYDLYIALWHACGGEKDDHMRETLTLILLVVVRRFESAPSSVPIRD